MPLYGITEAKELREVLSAEETQAAIDAAGKRTCRVVVGTSAAGWTAGDCDYLCDGSADQTEINQAITDVFNAGGGEVVLLDGTYKTSGNILFDHFGYITLRGANDSTTIQCGITGQGSAFPSSSCIAINDGTVTIKDLRLTTIANTDVGIYVDDNNSRIDNVTIDGYKYGIHLNSSQNKVKNCVIMGTSNSYGIMITTNNTSNEIKDNELTNCTNGIYGAAGTKLNQVIGNNLDSCQYSIYFNGSTTSPVELNMIANNFIMGYNNNSGVGIQLINSNHCSVTGNLIQLMDTGIKIRNTATSSSGVTYNNAIVGNTIFKGVYGIVASGTYLRITNISGNTISGTSNHGMQVNSGNYHIITSNLVSSGNANSKAPGTYMGIQMMSPASGCLLDSNGCMGYTIPWAWSGKNLCGTNQSGDITGNSGEGGLG